MRKKYVIKGAMIALLLCSVAFGGLLLKNKVGADTIKTQGLSISIYPDKSTIKSGETVTYTISVLNQSNKSGQFYIKMTPDFDGNKLLSNKNQISNISDWSLYNLKPGQTSTMTVPILINSDTEKKIKSVVQAYYETTKIKTFIAETNCIVAVNKKFQLYSEGYLLQSGNSSYKLVGADRKTIVDNLQATPNSSAIQTLLSKNIGTYVNIEGIREKDWENSPVEVLKITPKLISAEGILKSCSDSNLTITNTDKKEISVISRNGSKELITTYCKNYSNNKRYPVSVTGYQMLPPDAQTISSIDVTKINKIAATPSAGFLKGGDTNYQLVAEDNSTVKRKIVLKGTDVKLRDELSKNFEKYRYYYATVLGFQYYDDPYDYFDKKDSYSIDATAITPKTLSYEGIVKSCDDTAITIVNSDNKDISVIAKNGSKELITAYCKNSKNLSYPVKVTGFQMLNADLKSLSTIDIATIEKVVVAPIEGFIKSSSTGYQLLAEDSKTVKREIILTGNDVKLRDELSNNFEKFKNFWVIVEGYQYYPNPIDYKAKKDGYGIDPTTITIKTVSYDGSISSCGTDSIIIKTADNKDINIINRLTKNTNITTTCKSKATDPKTIYRFSGYAAYNPDSKYSVILDETKIELLAQ